jgi:hypothetical protein
MKMNDSICLACDEAFMAGMTITDLTDCTTSLVEFWSENGYVIGQFRVELKTRPTPLRYRKPIDPTTYLQA